MEKKNSGEFKLKENVILELRKKDGTVISKEEISNDIVNTGKQRVANLIGGISSSHFSHLAIGTGTTAVTTGDTSLETETHRVAPTIAYEADYKMTYEHTFTFGSAYAITEAGLFDSLTASGSTMLDRFVFTAKNVDTDTDLYVKVTITIS